MSEENKEKVEIKIKKKHLVTSVLIVVLVIVTGMLIYTFGEFSMEQQQTKLRLARLENVSNAQTVWIGALYNSTVLHEKFNLDVNQWYSKVENRFALINSTLHLGK